MNKKTRSDALERKINKSQFSQLILWLGQHSYKDVQWLVAAEPPVGFGLKVGLGSLCRFYQTHRELIEKQQEEQRALCSSVLIQNEQHARFSPQQLNNVMKWNLKTNAFFALNQHISDSLELSRLARIVEKTADI